MYSYSIVITILTYLLLITLLTSFSAGAIDSNFLYNSGFCDKEENVEVIYAYNYINRMLIIIITNKHK